MNLQMGQRIPGEAPSDCFEVIGFVGEGRTGEVYKVRDVAEGKEADERRALMAETGELADAYALKLAGAEAPLDARIEREWNVLTKLVHAGIPKPIARGRHGERMFLVMEWLEGGTLGAHLREQQGMRFRERMRLFLQMVEAVACCHEAGVVHRDLRPSNVLVVPGRGPVLIGFDSCGLFVPAGPADDPEPLGAIEYMEPERIARLRSPERVSLVSGPRADIYALGVLAYSLLTGQLPASGSPEAPSELFPDVPAACAELAMTLLGRDRPMDARELPALVRRVLAQDEAVLDRVAPAYQTEAETLAAPEVIARETPIWRRARWARLREPARRIASVALVVVAVGAAVRAYDEHAANARIEALSRAQMEHNAALTRTLESLVQQLSAASPRVVLEETAPGGLKMPEKPDPHWLKPGRDGKCREPSSGLEYQGYAVFRGACWAVSANGSYFTKPATKRPCAMFSYDPPPEAPTDFKRFCFNPIQPAEAPRSSLPEKPEN